MLMRLLTLMCLVSGCMMTNAFAAGSGAIPAAALQLSSRDANPIRPAVLDIPLPNQSRRTVHPVIDRAPVLAPAAIQWISGPLPLRCQAASSVTAKPAVANARSCLVI